MTSKRQKKAGFLLPDPIDGYDLIPFCGLIPDHPKYKSALRWLVWEMGKWGAWEKSYIAGDTRASDAATYMSEILLNNFKIGDCETMTLRQNPDNPCLLEQSTDGGETWTTAFNFDLCFGPAFQNIKQLIDNTGNRIIDELLDKYDGSAGSISENVIYDGSGDDAFRDNALCAIMQILVDSMCEAELGRREDTREVWDDYGNVLESIGQLIAGFGVPYLALPIAIVRAFVAAGAAAWAAADDAHLNNEDAKDNVACAMYNGLAGQTPTQSRFIECLDNSTFFIFSPEWYIAEAIRSMLPELEFYLAFLQLWGEFFPFAAAGLLDACNCPTTDWRVDWLGGFGQPPNTILTYDTLYHGSDYWYQVQASGNGAAAQCDIDMLADYTIKEIRIRIEKLNARYQSTDYIYALDENMNAIQTAQANAHCWGSTNDNGCWTDTIHTINFGDGLSFQAIRLAANAYAPSVNSEARITEIVVIGTGAKPVGW